MAFRLYLTGGLVKCVMRARGGKGTGGEHKYHCHPPQNKAAYYWHSKQRDRDQRSACDFKTGIGFGVAWAAKYGSFNG